MSNSPATPLSYSTPTSSKSSNSNQQQLKDIDYFHSSKSSSSTLSRTEILDLKCRLVNLKKQLKEREQLIEELKNKTTISEALQYEEEHRPYLEQQVKTLTDICEKLLTAVQEGGEADNQRLKCMEQLYSQHMEELIKTAGELKNENGRLKKLMTENGGKIGKIIQENDYLREENKYLEQEVDNLRKIANDERTRNKELKLELKKQELTQRHISSSHANRLKDEIIATKHECSLKMESVRISAEDQLKEQELEIKRLKLNEDVLRKEIVRKEGTLEKMAKLMEQMLEENKKTLEKVSSTKKVVEKEVSQLKKENSFLKNKLGDIQQKYRDLESLCLKQTEDEGCYSYGSTKSQLIISAREQQISRDKHTIEKLQKQIDDLKKIPHATNPQRMLMEKSIKVRELEERIKLLTDELLLERDQRETATCLLAEMTKDMKILCGEK
uniref:Uncharacterized protein n=1 Tax=Parastrongyloides trichosuri TaxID=131310 RepID=A0A0N4Z9W0_PARTI